MRPEFYFVSGLFLILIIVLQVRSYRKQKKQNQLLIIQGEEIKKQVQELEQQNHLLAELNVEKQQIIGVVSHDLKGPFNRIFALVQLMSLSRGTLSEDHKEYLGKIHQIVADGLGMVRNLLDNRRFEDRGIDLKIEKLDVSSLVSSLVKNYSVLAEKKMTTLHFEGPAQLLLESDKLCLTRIMDNLISNALKFIPPGRNIYVSVNPDESRVVIRVRDEGPGLSPEDQGKLFQKYQRLTPRPTGGESSTGLGLYLVNVMVNKLGGTVSCESEENKGATFAVQLKKPGISEDQLKR